MSPDPSVSPWVGLAEQQESPAVANNGRSAVPSLDLVPASSVRVTRPSWLYAKRIPDNGVTLLAGLEGLGKTLISLWLAARITRGQLPGDREGRPGSVVYVGIEDDWASISVPRLIAAGADLDRVHFVNLAAGGVFSVENDLADLSVAVECLPDLAVVIIDPLDAHLGDGVDSHRKSEVQRTVQGLAGLAQAHRCAVLGIGHLNKNEISRDVLMRVIGSKGFTTSARSVLAVGKHPGNEGEALLVVRKSNFGAIDVPALRFRAEGCEIDHPDDGGRVATAIVAWLGEEHVDADSILRTEDPEERSEREQAAAWLTDLLSDGTPCPYKEVERLASEAGISRATLHRARPLAEVVVERDDGAQGRPSTWRLSSPSHTLLGETKQKNAFVSDSDGPPETKEKDPTTRDNSLSKGGLVSIESVSETDTKAEAKFGPFALCGRCAERHTYAYLDGEPICPKCKQELEQATQPKEEKIGRAHV